LLPLLIFYILIILSVLAVGWVCVAKAIKAYKQNEYDDLTKSWKLLKYGSVPFYILNFLLSLYIWSILLIGTRGFLVFLMPLPIMITCTMIFQSGCLGWCCIQYLNKLPDRDKKISKIHYVMQAVAVLDVISTIFIGRKEQNINL
jgi:hypothetical protein